MTNKEKATKMLASKCKSIIDRIEDGTIYFTCDIDKDRYFNELVLRIALACNVDWYHGKNSIKYVKKIV